VNCRHALRLIPLHAGGDLPAAQVAELELHLVGCGGCAGELQAFAELRAVVSSTRVPAPAGGLWGALDSRLDAVDAARRLRRPWYRSPWLFSAAAAALALALVPPWVPSAPAGAAPADPSRPGPAVMVASGTPGGAGGPLLTPVSAPAEGLQQVPNAELVRFLHENAGLRQPVDPDGGLVASPAGRRVREF